MLAHRLLFIPELLFDVFNVLEPEPTKSSDQAGKKMARRTLASCALVCKAWEEVATECLWRDLPSALCLLGILGSLTYRKDVNDKGWYFADPITDPNRIHRFLHLANRVHTLAHHNAAWWNNVTSSVVSNSALQSIMPIISPSPNPIGGKFLCPKLRRLHWISDLKQSHDLLHYLMPPSLQTFDLWLIVTMLYSMTWDDVDSAFHSAMKPVTAGLCCELEAFHFLSDNRGPPPSLAKSLAQFLSKQTQLKEVDIFVSLGKCIATALATSSQSIRSLSCHICPKRAGISVSEAIDLISSSCSVLEELTAIVNTEFRVSDLRGLLSCNTLRKLRISYWTLHSQLEAKEIETMATSWPDLEVLHLLSNNPYPRPPTPLSILATIARCMRPTLKDLGLELFVDETVPLATSLEAVPFIGLQNLVIGDSSTIQNGHEQDAAMYLGSIFPHDVKISMRNRPLPGVTSGATLQSLDGWNKVVGLRQTSRSASTEEAAPGI